MTHYDEFGVTPTAPPHEIQRAHRNLARLLHPDLIQDEEVRRLAERQLQRLNVIYSILADPERRRVYDLQLSSRTRPGQEAIMLRRPASSWTRWRLPATCGAVSLAIGIQSAVWWVESRVPEPGIVYVDRTQPSRKAAIAEPRATQPASPSATREEVEQLAAETRELRRVLNHAVLERDQAMARLASLRSAPAIPAGSVDQDATRPAGPPAGAEPSRSGEPFVVAEVEASKPAHPNLAGTWIYSARGASTSPSDRYPAEYIELLLGEREGLLWGRYRARYKVPDRALSPEVEFFFEGSKADQERRFTWRGNGGAAGEVHLKLLSDHTLSLDWFTSRLGRNLTLGSGTAVLVRRRQD